jgi:hypothetical protein
MSKRDIRLLVFGFAFLALTLGGSGFVYFYARWIAHNVGAATPLAIITAVAGLVVTTGVLIEIWWRSRKT